METSVASVLNEAVGLHRQGFVDQAVERYRQILRTDPTQVDALYYLAMAACQQNRFAEGIDHAQAALALDPRQARAHNLMGMALNRLGRNEAALASFTAAIAAQPDFADGYGNRANVLCELGRLGQAVEDYDRALALRADSPEDWTNRGTTLHQLGRHEEALASLDRAIAVAPGSADACFLRANVLAHMRRYEEALAGYERTLALAPRHGEAHNNRGSVLMTLGRDAAALADFEAALAVDPAHAAAMTNRCTVLHKLGRFNEAIAACDRLLAIDRRNLQALISRGMALGAQARHDQALASFDEALRIEPDHVAALTNRAAALLELYRIEDALETCERALIIRPDHPDALFNHGAALSALARHDAAVAAYTRVLAIKPDHAEALYRRGAALRDLGRYDQATTDLEAAMASAGGHPAAQSAWTAIQLLTCNWPAIGELTANAGAATVFAAEPFFGLALGLSPADQLRCAQERVQRGGMNDVVRFSHRITDRTRLRVAYLSSDFRTHPVAYLTAELFERHDRTRFEVIGVSLRGDDGSDYRRRLARAFDQFHEVEQESDDAVAGLLKDLEVDVAVDLNGHTDHSRMGILARRPAPIHVSYIGYPGTSGAPFIDYVLADAIVLPFSQQRFYAEKIVHLPNCFQVNDSKLQIAPERPTRRELGLPEDGFVFCCFNNPYKIRPEVFDIWMRLLGAVSGSVLWLFGSNDIAVANLRREAQARGVDTTRLVFAKGLPIERHLARHAVADLFLDTLPYNGGATTSGALWAGLPVLTCAGDSFAGRMGASLVTAVGLAELATRSLDEYEAVAARLATAPAEMQAIRQKLRANLPHCPLFDADRRRRHIEAAYGSMWDIWQRGEDPRSFSVDD
jgi:predicted O-linked N-acetylglucosamine transferase (SPINDLY family)